jgi:hypothetical protein
MASLCAFFSCAAHSVKHLQEELILLRMRDNKTGEYLDLNDYLDKIGSIKVASLKLEH